MMYSEGDFLSEQQADETQHFQAMLFKTQCLWRDYEEMMVRPHNPKKESLLLDEIDILEANLREMGTAVY